MQNEKMTVGELLDKFDNYRVSASGKSVLIHPGLQFGFLEVTPEFRDRLKAELEAKVNTIVMGFDKPDAITQFALMMLEHSY